MSCGRPGALLAAGRRGRSGAAGGHALLHPSRPDPPPALSPDHRPDHTAPRLPAPQVWFYRDPSGAQQGPCCITDFRNWLAYLNRREPDPQLERERERNLAEFLLVPVWQQHEPAAAVTLSRLIEGQDRAAGLL